MDVLMDGVDHVEVTHTLSIEVRDGVIYVADQQLYDDEVQRSTLLKQLLDSAGSTSVPLSGDLFNRWRQYVKADMERSLDSAPQLQKDELAKLTLTDKAAILEVCSINIIRCACG